MEMTQEHYEYIKAEMLRCSTAPWLSACRIDERQGRWEWAREAGLDIYLRAHVMTYLTVDEIDLALSKIIEAINALNIVYRLPYCDRHGDTIYQPITEQDINQITESILSHFYWQSLTRAQVDSTLRRGNSIFILDITQYRRGRITLLFPDQIPYCEPAFTSDDEYIKYMYVDNWVRLVLESGETLYLFRQDI